ncbi:MAG: hypothetical protein WEA35_07470 [Candidatus Nanopelagicales bacterium]
MGRISRVGAAALATSALRVPRDYTDPAAGRTSIAVLRMRTSDPVRRVGHLVVNPGGPGVAGRTGATALSFSLPGQVTSR